MARASESPRVAAPPDVGGDVGQGRRGDRHRCAAGAHTYLPDGARLCWRPPPGVTGAVDAEPASAPVPEQLDRRLPPGSPADRWGAWTRAEVCAKLLDVPVLVWWTRHGWPAEGRLHHGGRTVELTTLRWGGLVCSFGTVTSSAP